MDKRTALDLATRLAAAFPRFRAQALTLEAWAEEFLPLDPITGQVVLERLKYRLDSPPSVKELTSAIKTVRNAEDSARLHAKALSWETTAANEEQPTTFAEWAVTDPARARKLVGALTGDSYVRGELQDVIAKGSEIFDTLATDRREPTVDDRYTWNRHDPPCDRCGRRVENGPNAQSNYDRDTDTWTNAHIECSAEAHAQPGTRVN